MNEDMMSILDYLTEMRGVDFHGYRASMIERRVTQGFSSVCCQNAGEYLIYLKENSNELDYLLDRLTINVSQFFRDPLIFEVIADRILPEMVYLKKERHNHSLRIWSAGCSMGEEPYSVAMLLREFLNKETLDADIRVFGTDIDIGILKKAENALYAFESVKNVKYGLLKKYFTIQGELFQLSPEIRNMVSFSRYDVLDTKHIAPPESIFGSFDIVLCRNLLIYFTPSYQMQILDKLSKTLCSNGYLILGDVESLPEKYRPRFHTKMEQCHIYQKR